MNPFRELLAEVRGTESEAMKQIAAVTRKIQADRAKKERARAASAAAKEKK